MKKLIPLFIAVIVLPTFSIQASEKPSPKGFEHSSNKEIRQKIDWQNAKIKNNSELFASASDPNSPINKLSPGAQQRFLGSVTFNEKGVTGFYYQDLELELTKSEIYRILADMGAQHMMPMFKKAREDSELDTLIGSYNYSTSSGEASKDFLLGYKCISKGTCTRRLSYACTKNC